MTATPTLSAGRSLPAPRQTTQDLAHEREIAESHCDKVSCPVALDLIQPGPRRAWDGTWAAYDALMQQDLRGQTVLVPGCGFGEDAIRLAKLGAKVVATDAAPALLDIARRRAEHFGVHGIAFDAAFPARLPYAAGLFDLVFFDDLLHHVDIAATLAETARVLKPGGRVVISEHYSHSAVQLLRDSRLVDHYLHPRMLGFVYGARAYVSGVGHKIDETELAAIEAAMLPDRRIRFFSLFSGRVLPADSRKTARLDFAILNAAAPLGRLLAGRVMVSGGLRGRA